MVDLPSIVPLDQEAADTQEMRAIIVRALEAKGVPAQNVSFPSKGGPHPELEVAVWNGVELRCSEGPVRSTPGSSYPLELRFTRS